MSLNSCQMAFGGLLLCVFANFVLSETVKVAIIGSGPSGVSAATTLLRNDVSDIVVLEAEGRMGGRVYSVPIGDGFADLGGQWCHGEKGNVVHELAEPYGLLGISSETLNVIVTADAHVDTNSNVTILDFMDAFYTTADEQNRNKSIQAHFDEKYESVINGLFPTDEGTRNLMLSAKGMMGHYMLSGEGAFRLQDISVAGTYKECEGAQAQHWKGKGYRQVLDLMAQKPPHAGPVLPLDEKIRYNLRVMEIDWQSAPIKITCNDSSTIEADYVIFTPSLGVLKADHTTLFKPTLPDNKVRAIENLGIGGVMKIVLHFPEQCGPDNLWGLSFLWSDADKLAAKSANKEWVLDIFAMIPVDCVKNVMVMWLTGDSVPEVEGLSDSAIEEGVKFVLDRLVKKHYSCQYPDKIINSKWYTNPSFRGVYSFETPTSFAEGIKNNPHIALGAPLLKDDDKSGLLFAGEATCPEHYGTVHGAIETGRREAERILRIMNKKI